MKLFAKLPVALTFGLKIANKQKSGFCTIKGGVIYKFMTAWCKFRYYRFNRLTLVGTIATDIVLLEV